MNEDGIENLEKSLGGLAALSDPLAMRIILFLKRRGPMTISDLVRSFAGRPVSQPAVSLAVKRLCKNNLVLRNEMYGQRYYLVYEQSLADIFSVAKLMFLDMQTVSGPMDGEEVEGK